MKRSWAVDPSIRNGHAGHGGFPRRGYVWGDPDRRQRLDQDRVLRRHAGCATTRADQAAVTLGFNVDGAIAGLTISDASVQGNA